MTDEQKPPEYDYHYQVDQQVSVNAFFDAEIAGDTVRFQITSRYGSTPEKIAKTVRAAIDAYTLLRQEFPRQFVQPPQQEERIPIDDSGHELPKVKTFTADKLDVSTHNGKIYFKVIGKPFVQYGVTAWPEVLEAAGLKYYAALPNIVPNIAGWQADYIEEVKDGKKRMKITRLLPPK